MKKTMFDIAAVRAKIDKCISNKSYKNEQILSELEVKHINSEHNIIINCYAYALLGIETTNHDDYLALCKRECERGDKSNGMQSDFVIYLLKNEVFHKVKPIKSSLVLYFDQNAPKHAGVLEKDGDDDDKIVRSSWGDLGIKIHKLWYVPTIYGNDVKYYEPLNPNDSLKYFSEFIDKFKQR